MFRLAVFLGLASTTLAIVQFKVTDCATSPNKVVSVSNIQLSNVDPIDVSQNETLSMDVNVLQHISGMHYKVEINVQRHVLFGYVNAPCFIDVSKNTCEFELCEFLSNHFASESHKCPAAIAASTPDLKCVCPFSPGSYRINPTTFMIDLYRQYPWFRTIFQQGDFKANLNITDTYNNDIVACFTLEASTGVTECTGISCLIGRK